MSKVKSEGGGGKAVAVGRRLSHMTLLHCIETRPICEFCFSEATESWLWVQLGSCLWLVACSSTWLHIIKKYLRFTFRKDNNEDDNKGAAAEDDKRKCTNNAIDTQIQAHTHTQSHIPLADKISLWQVAVVWAAATATGSGSGSK